MSLGYTDAAHVHAVTEAGANRYRYDANGNMTYRDEGNDYHQFWTGDNLLERITWSERVYLTLYGHEVRLGYDGKGRHLRKWHQETLLSILSQADTSVETSLSLYPLPGYEIDLRWQDGEAREEQSQEEYWDYQVNNHQLVGQGNVADDKITFYSQPGRVCHNKDWNKCVFEARSLYRDEANNLHEIIIAYGRFWHTQWVNGIVQSGADNGQLLTALARFRGSGGPCAGRRGTDCHFESYARFWLGQNLVESLSAGGRFWDFAVTDTGYTVWNQGKPLSGVLWYRAAGGPCQNKSGNSCVFQARDIYVDGQGDLHEVVLAEGKKWHWEWVGGLRGTRYVREKGVNLKDILHYREGPCWELDRKAACQIEAVAFLNHEVESLTTGENVRAAKWQETNNLPIHLVWRRDSQIGRYLQRIGNTRRGVHLILGISSGLLGKGRTSGISGVSKVTVQNSAASVGSPGTKIRQKQQPKRVVELKPRHHQRLFQGRDHLGQYT